MRVTGVVPVGTPQRCDACSGMFLWAYPERLDDRRKLGRAIPVDAQLSMLGNLVCWFEVDGFGTPVGAQRVMVAPADYQGPRWQGHEAVCPRATAYRRSQSLRGVL